MDSNQTDLKLKKLIYFLKISQGVKENIDLCFYARFGEKESFFFDEDKKLWCLSYMERGIVEFEQHFPSLDDGIKFFLIPDGLFDVSVSLEEFQLRCKIKKERHSFFSGETDLILKGDDPLKKLINQLVLEYKEGNQSLFRFIRLAWKNYKIYISDI